MGEVCVITGGGSGMGLAAAKNMPKEKIILISGRTEKKLERASEELHALADTDKEAFMKKALRMSSFAKGDYQKAGFAYSISKNFTVWYAQKCAFRYGKRGIRVVSLSPGLIATDMGNLEKAEGGSMVSYTAEERMGTPEELGYALATIHLGAS